MSSSISRADVLALMPFPILTKVDGEPTYQAMKQWKKEMSSNLISVSMPADWGRGKGLLGELQDAAIFLARNGAAYNPPAAAPPAYPVIPVGATTTQREELRATNATANINWNKAVHAKRLAVNIGAQALEQFVYAELDDPDEGLNGVDIMDLYNHVMDRFATISQMEIDANMAEFMEQMDPTTTLAVYNRRRRNVVKRLRKTPASQSRKPQWSPQEPNTPSQPEEWKKRGSYGSAFPPLNKLGTCGRRIGQQPSMKSENSPNSQVQPPSEWPIRPAKTRWATKWSTH